jgi:gamma-glutamylcyclotransferase (GGCT)/AIG2-like uncharacterized protein YtfP
MPGADTEQVRIFAYGSLLPGERDHSLLAGAEPLGAARTAPRYTLVDLGFYPALLVGGETRVAGELYLVQKKTRFAIDVHKQCPVLFQRAVVELDDGSQAEAYFMRDEQVRGKRRLKQGSWRDRFAPEPRTGPRSAFVEWAKKRTPT